MKSKLTEKELAECIAADPLWTPGPNPARVAARAAASALGVELAPEPASRPAFWNHILSRNPEGFFYDPVPGDGSCTWLRSQREFDALADSHNARIRLVAAARGAVGELDNAFDLGIHHHKAEHSSHCRSCKALRILRDALSESADG